MNPFLVDEVYDYLLRLQRIFTIYIMMQIFYELRYNVLEKKLTLKWKYPSQMVY